jgi:hypothetical protein
VIDLEPNRVEPYLIRAYCFAMMRKMDRARLDLVEYEQKGGKVDAKMREALLGSP